MLPKHTCKWSDIYRSVKLTVRQVKMETVIWIMSFLMYIFILNSSYISSFLSNIFFTSFFFCCLTSALSCPIYSLLPSSFVVLHQLFLVQYILYFLLLLLSIFLHPKKTVSQITLVLLFPCFLLYYWIHFPWSILSTNSKHWFTTSFNHCRI